MLANWKLADGTYIAMYAWDESAEFPFLLYSNEDVVLQIGGIYNTAGL